MKEYIEREQAIALFYPVDPENDGSDGCTMEYPVKPDDFCSYGQRKEADHEVSEP